MLKIKLSASQIRELNEIRRKTDDPRNERALAVLMSHDGLSPPQISKQIKRHYNTVIDWLKRYAKHGANGLMRRYSPGRPSERNTILAPILDRCLSRHPGEFGYPEQAWDTALIKKHCFEKSGRNFSNDTIERALHDAGYVYKRPRKSVPETAASKPEKKAKILKIIDDIKEILDKQDAEIFALDEAHFSTEPYVVRGWRKRGEPFFPPHFIQKTKCHSVWRIQFGTKKFLLEKM